VSCERLTADISRDLRAFAQDMRVEHRNTDAVLLAEAADKLDGLIALLAEAETERDQARSDWEYRGHQLDDAAAVGRAVIAERDRLAETNARLEVERDDALALVAACTTRQQRRLAETIRKVREIHSPPPGWEREWKDPAKALAQGWPPCAGCATVATFTPIGKCRTLAALGDIPSPTAPEAPKPPLYLCSGGEMWAITDLKAWMDEGAAAVRDSLTMPAPVEPEGTPDAEA
jgi:hypothetical protein